MIDLKIISCHEKEGLCLNNFTVMWRTYLWNK